MSHNSVTKFRTGFGPSQITFFVLARNPHAGQGHGDCPSVLQHSGLACLWGRSLSYWQRWHYRWFPYLAWTKALNADLHARGQWVDCHRTPTSGHAHPPHPGLPRTGETLQSPQNADLLSKLLTLWDHAHAPFIIGGDWQNSPDALAATVIMSKFQCQIVDSENPPHFKGLNSIICWSVALAVTLSCDMPDVEVQQLHDFHPLAKFMLYHSVGAPSMKLMGPFPLQAFRSLAWAPIWPDGPVKQSSTSPTNCTSPQQGGATTSS